MSATMRHIIAISGGKDSTALAIWLRQRHPEIAYEYASSDTGRELPELYAFLDRLEGILGQPVKRLVDGWHCRQCDVAGTKPDMLACPQCGGPVVPRDMDYYMERWSTPDSGPYLPSKASRWCTKHLKIRPFERFIGKDQATVYIAFRSDEDRVGNYADKPNIAYAYPFQEEGVDLAGVRTILAEAGVALPDFYKWRGVGGCWNCPFQKPKHWLGLSRNHPELFERAVAEESKGGFYYGRLPLPLLIRKALRDEEQGTLFNEDAGDALEGACAICSK